MTDETAFYPQQVVIDAYGNGGFRFGGGSHRGSLLFLPSGVYGWAVSSFDDLKPDLCRKILSEAGTADFVLLGTGERQIFPDPALSALFDEAGLGLEVMDTGAACRTYNLMLEEKRAVMAALIAVD